ncbi:hypothetical protein JCM8097_002927 [Rhodosporidiobolus ruineniae]
MSHLTHLRCQPPQLLALGAVLSSLLLASLHTRFRRSYASFVGMGPGALPHSVVGPLPQRPFTDAPNAELAKTQLSSFAALADTYPSLLTLAVSHLENHGPALKLARPLSTAPERARADLELTRGEIAHLHDGPFSFPHRCSSALSRPSSPGGPDGAPTFRPGPAPQSLHVLLSPSDARLVLRQGWGLRHPLSGSRLPWPLNGAVKEGGRLPEGYVLLYAPRDEAEWGVLERVVRAGVRYATEGKV